MLNYCRLCEQRGAIKPDVILCLCPAAFAPAAARPATQGRVVVVRAESDQHGPLDVNRRGLLTATGLAGLASAVSLPLSAPSPALANNKVISSDWEQVGP